MTLSLGCVPSTAVDLSEQQLAVNLGRARAGETVEGRKFAYQSAEAWAVERFLLTGKRLPEPIELSLKHDGRLPEGYEEVFGE